MIFPVHKEFKRFRFAEFLVSNSIYYKSNALNNDEPFIRILTEIITIGQRFLANCKFAQRGCGDPLLTRPLQYT